MVLPSCRILKIGYIGFSGVWYIENWKCCFFRRVVDFELD